MIACAECGASTSTAAAACPACGANRKAMIGRQPITPFGWAWRSLLAMIALLMVVTAWRAKDVATSNSTAVVDQKSPQEEAEGNARLHSAMADVAALKHSLRDPGSLSLDRVLASKVGDVVCIRYRARNGFGGMNLEHVVFVDNADGSSSTRVWKKRCVHSGLLNITGDIAYAMEATGS